MTGMVCIGLPLTFCLLNKQALDILGFREEDLSDVIHIIKVRSMHRSGTEAF